MMNDDMTNTVLNSLIDQRKEDNNRHHIQMNGLQVQLSDMRTEIKDEMKNLKDDLKKNIEDLFKKFDCQSKTVNRIVGGLILFGSSGFISLVVSIITLLIKTKLL